MELKLKKTISFVSSFMAHVLFLPAFCPFFETLWLKNVHYYSIEVHRGIWSLELGKCLFEWLQ